MMNERGHKEAVKQLVRFLSDNRGDQVQVAKRVSKIADHLNAILQPSARKGDKLWHYTTGDRLLQILRCKKLWLTQIGCVNDSTELHYARQIYANALDHAALTLPDEGKSLLKRASERMRSESVPISDRFVGSVSAEADLLSQWRAYGGNEGGSPLASARPI